MKISHHQKYNKFDLVSINIERLNGDGDGINGSYQDEDGFSGNSYSGCTDLFNLAGDIRITFTDKNHFECTLVKLDTAIFYKTEYFTGDRY